MSDDIPLAPKAFYSVELSLHLLEVSLQLAFSGIEALTLRVKVTNNTEKLVKGIQSMVDGIVDTHRTPGLRGRRQAWLLPDVPGVGRRCRSRSWHEGLRRLLLGFLLPFPVWNKLAGHRHAQGVRYLDNWGFSCSDMRQI